MRPDRMGAGPWARLVASAVVPDEGAARAERGRALARAGAVRDVDVTRGCVTASVRGSTGNVYTVSLDVEPLAPERWRAAVRAARGNPQLRPGVEGTAQSLHLAHWLEAEHREPLVPPSRALRRRCTCPDHEWSSGCKHVAAVAFAFAELIDRDPSLLLRWRGCDAVTPTAPRNADPWRGGQLPPPRPVRPLPPGAVLKRLGRSGIRVGGRDLAEALEPAYRAFAGLEDRPHVP